MRDNGMDSDGYTIQLDDSGQIAGVTGRNEQGDSAELREVLRTCAELIAGEQG